MHLSSSCSVERPLPSVAYLVQEAWSHAPLVRRRIAASFPGLCEGVLEDALQEAMLALVADPAPWRRAWAEGGKDRMRALLHVIAWRKARGAWRRHGWRRSVHVDAMDEVGRAHLPSQLLMATFRLELEEAIEAAVVEARAGDPGPVRAALLDALVSGETDTALAARHGTRREYVNRARRALGRWGSA